MFVITGLEYWQNPTTKPLRQTPPPLWQPTSTSPHPRCHVFIPHYFTVCCFVFFVAQDTTAAPKEKNDKKVTKDDKDKVTEKQDDKPTKKSGASSAVQLHASTMAAVLAPVVVGLLVALWAAIFLLPVVATSRDFLHNDVIIHRRVSE